MGVNKHSGRSIEEIQRENMKRLRKKQLEKKRREKAEKVRQQNLAKQEQEKRNNVNDIGSTRQSWTEAMEATDLKESTIGKKSKSARPAIELQSVEQTDKKKEFLVRKSARPSNYNSSAVTAKTSTNVPVRKSANPLKQQPINAGNTSKGSSTGKIVFVSAAAVLLLALGIFLGIKLWPDKTQAVDSTIENALVADGGEVIEQGEAVGKNKSGILDIFSFVSGKKDSEPTEVIEMEERIPLAPYYTEETNPANLISYTEVNVDGTTLSSVSEYQPLSRIDFGAGEEYASIDGIATFRGNNFRNNPTFGHTNMTEFKMNGEWSYNTSSLSYNGVWWTGSGWTGQPLMAKWPKETKEAMNMHDWAKQDDELVEVIYACMDGYIYFLDLMTGKETREPMYLGYTFKGAGALDPRGYPIMYVGAGYDSNNGTARSFIINLLDCSVMHTFGNLDEFSMRGSLSYFDSSALVDAETDTLIYPGENGILYLIKLNTQYDPAAGTLSINPGNIVKWRYWGTRSSTYSYWVGMETSAACYGGYLYIADNGGNLMCLDLNTLELMWVQDILDDSNSTPILSVENGKLYIYVSTSFHLGWRSSGTADVPIWKIDAENGEIIWQTSYECYSEDALSGGVQSTIATGANALDDYIYVTVSRTGGYADGVLACIKKDTGDIVWEHDSFYAWSSPVCVYNEDGTGKVLYCTCGGNMYLLDGITGEVHDTFELVDGEGAVEASPAVYNDHVVVGTRECKIWGITLS